MSKNYKGRGTLSGELASALARLAAKAPVFSVGEFAEALGRPKSETWRVLHFLMASLHGQVAMRVRDG